MIGAASHEQTWRESTGPVIVSDMDFHAQMSLSDIAESCKLLELALIGSIMERLERLSKSLSDTYIQ